MSRKRVSRIIYGEKTVKGPRETILKSYEGLIETWYWEYPFLKATQVYQWLRTYGFEGSYEAVCLFTQQFRKRRRESYHELEFLPGEEAQIDWMEWQFLFGVAYGFVFLLAYSRYLYVNLCFALLKLFEMIPENFESCPFKLATILDSTPMAPPFP